MTEAKERIYHTYKEFEEAHPRPNLIWDGELGTFRPKTELELAMDLSPEAFGAWLAQDMGAAYRAKMQEFFAEFSPEELEQIS